MDQKKLEEYLSSHPTALESSDDSESSSDDDDDDKESSSVSSKHSSVYVNFTNFSLYQESCGSRTDTSSDDEYEDPRCRVCSQTPFMNQFKQPEKLIKCTTCKHQGKDIVYKPFISVH